MTREQLSSIIGRIDDRHIAEAYQFNPARCGRSPERTAPMKKKRFFAFVLAAALLLSLGAAAYAADLFGLRALYANPNRGELPEEAAALIEPQHVSVEGDGWRAEVLESYCDEGTVLLTVRISTDEGYLVAPGAEDPDSPLWVIGLEGEETLGDYARREGQTLLFAQASLDTDALGLTSAGMRFENTSPREMTVFFEGVRSGGMPGPIETNCTIVILPWQPEAAAQDPAALAAERHTLPVTLAESGSTLLGVYAPDDSLAVPGIELGELRLTQTPLGIRLRLEMNVLDEEAAGELLTLRLDGVEFHGSGVIDPNGYAVFDQGQGDFCESPTIRFLDWDKNMIAAVTFEKVG